MKKKNDAIKFNKKGVDKNEFESLRISQFFVNLSFVQLK